MENLQMMIQGSGNKSSLDSGSSKDEKNDMNNGISGEGHIVSWNKFLPFRSLKVLVVESDDSTRHVVSALLKKCGYEVIAVANGIQAWKALEDQNNHVDIVLTEVVLPFLTGLGLLRTIMSHKTHKNLPVIMMSPSDSLGVVFKCLSKGAADFLVKPIRKNELKTLWQHVWRKRHSASSGSVAESDTVARSIVPVKTPVTGKSGSSSNNGDDNMTNGLNNGSHGLSDRNGSDQGSGTQVPEDNRKVKLSPPAAAVAGHLSDPHMHSWDLNHSAVEQEGHAIGDKPIGRDLAARVAGNQTLKLKHSNEKMTETKASSRGKTVRVHTSKDKQHVGKGLFEINKKALGEELGNEDAQVAAASTKNGDAHLVARSEVRIVDMGLKQNEGDKGNGGKAARQRSVLGHSSHSAFSRYGSALKVLPKVQNGNDGSLSPLESGSDRANGEDVPKYQGNLTGSTTDHNSDDNRIAYQKGLNETVVKPRGCKYKQPMKPITVQQATHTPGEAVSKVNGSSGQTSLDDQQELSPHNQQTHHYHPYHHQHQHYYCQNMQKVSNHGDTTMNDVPSIDRQLQPPFLGHNAGCGGMNMFGVNPMADAGIVYGFMNGITANRQLQRLAAIHKFRQKRKDRCYNKKVRCESRRPRMKGQFVRRTDISDNNGVHFC